MEERNCQNASCARKNEGRELKSIAEGGFYDACNEKEIAVKQAVL